MIEIQAPMTGAELRAAREWLGLTRDWLADHLGVAERSVARWEVGSHAVPPDVVAQVEQLLAHADEVVAYDVEELAGREQLEPRLIHADETTYPEGWQRRIAWRVRRQVPTLRILGSGDEE